MHSGSRKIVQTKDLIDVAIVIKLIQKFISIIHTNLFDSVGYAWKSEQWLTKYFVHKKINLRCHSVHGNIWTISFQLLNVSFFDSV